LQTPNERKIDPPNDKPSDPNFCKYPFSQNRIQFRGKRVKKDKVYSYIKDLIDEGVTSITDIAVKIGKERKQTRRYLQDMARLGLVKLNPETGTLLKKSHQNTYF
jgi:hypothetical protein